LGIKILFEDRGIIIDQKIYSNEYWDDALNAILAFDKNEELKQSYINKAKNWAINQTCKMNQKNG